MKLLGIVAKTSQSNGKGETNLLVRKKTTKPMLAERKLAKKKGRGAETKILVVVAKECKGKQIGCVRFKCIPYAPAENL